MAVASPLNSTIIVGHQARMNINAKTMCIHSAVPMSTREIVSNVDNSICADIDHPIIRAQKGRQMVGWTVKLDLTWPMIEVIFPLLGNSGGAAPWVLGATDVLVAFPCNIDLGDKVHTLTNCFVAKWSISGSKGGRPIQMELSLMGETELIGSFTPDQITLDKEYAFHHGTLTMEDDSTGPPGADLARPYDRFMLSVDNKPVVEYNNSVTYTDVAIGGRQAVFATSVPYVTAHDDLYIYYRDYDDGLNAVLVLSNGSKIITFAMPECMAVSRPASVLGKAQQIRTPVTMLMHYGDNIGTRINTMTITPSGP